MMDLLLEKVFSPNKWNEAINTGNDKGIDRATLKKFCLPANRMELKRKLENQKKG